MVVKNNYSEKELIQALRKGNGMALSYVYDQYSPALYGVILRIVQDEPIAEEVLQDSLIKVWERIDQYDSDKGRFFTWILNISRNQAIDKTRGKEISQKNMSDSLQKGNLESKADSKRVSDDFIGIPEVILQLPEEQQYVINQIYFKGFSHSELSKTSGIPLGTVKTRVRNALKHLRTVLLKSE